jgi:signal transduction histidine kinase
MRAGRYVKISFHDTGIGIPSENLAKIFDPYFSTKDTYNQKGLGLGLAVCYSVIKEHDGLITVESEVGKGTTYYIYLPAAGSR